MPLSILLAEDNPVIHGIMADLLRSEGHRVEIAINGMKAIELLQGTTHYDLILLDLYLPHMNGLEVLKKLRTLASYRKTPVLMLSGDHSEESRYECMAAGANDYLLKPLPPIALLDLVAQYDHPAPSRITDKDASLINQELIQDLAMALASNKKLHRIIHNFIYTTRSQLHELQQEEMQHNLHQCLAIIHSMKGSAGMFGAEKLMQQCRSLEGMELSQLTASLPTLASLVEATIQELEHMMQKHII